MLKSLLVIILWDALERATLVQVAKGRNPFPEDGHSIVIPGCPAAADKGVGLLGVGAWLPEVSRVNASDA